MAGTPIPKAEQDEIARRLAAGETASKVAADTGRHFRTVVRYGRPGRPADPPPPTPKTGFRETEEGAEASVITDKPVRTQADAMAAAGVDEAVWYVHEWQATLWTTGMKLGRKGNDRAVQQQQYLVRLRLRRLHPRSHQKAAELLFERMAAAAPRYPDPPPKRPGKGESHLVVMGLVDVHFGRLCWAPETGANYDLKKAEAVYDRAVATLMARTAGVRVGRFCLPVGNDLLHVDSQRNATWSGTPQDVDGRFAKVMVTAEVAVIRAVERMAAVAPVDVVWVPGNHDPTASFHLMRAVAAWFRNNRRVACDTSPATRKYVRYGASLVGFTHGDKEKPESLPAIMAQERPADWAAARCREWLRGHDHRPRKWVAKATDTYDGVTVRSLPSPAAPDAWHAGQGYVGVTRAVEAYLYAERSGYVGHAVAGV